MADSFHAEHTDESRRQSVNKMQSETADVAPGAATWRAGRNIRLVIDSGQLAPL